MIFFFEFLLQKTNTKRSWMATIYERWSSVFYFRRRKDRLWKRASHDRLRFLERFSPSTERNTWYVTTNFSFHFFLFIRFQTSLHFLIQRRIGFFKAQHVFQGNWSSYFYLKEKLLRTYVTEGGTIVKWNKYDI